MIMIEISNFDPSTANEYYESFEEHAATTN